MVYSHRRIASASRGSSHLAQGSQVDCGHRGWNQTSHHSSVICLNNLPTRPSRTRDDWSLTHIVHGADQIGPLADACHLEGGDVQPVLEPGGDAGQGAGAAHRHSLGVTHGEVPAVAWARQAVGALWKLRWPDGQTDRRTERQTDGHRQTNGHTGGQTESDRETGRRTDRPLPSCSFFSQACN